MASGRPWEESGEAPGTEALRAELAPEQRRGSTAERPGMGSAARKAQLRDQSGQRPPQAMPPQ